MYDDGFAHRFCIALPDPPELSIDEIIDCPKPEFSLSTLFMFIAALHEIPRQYELTKEGFELMKVEYNLDKQNMKLANTFMYYFS